MDDKFDRAYALTKMMAAHHALNEADAALFEALRAAFPEGSHVLYHHQRDGRLHQIRGEVIFHCAGRYYSGCMVIKNLATGKSRRVSVPYEYKHGRLEALL